MDLKNPAIDETLLIALVGFAVVFAVLIALMLVIWIMSKAVGGRPVKKTPIVPVAPPPVPATPTGVVLENVSDREAAMIMAIVADKMQKDPATLRFVSIKEVQQ